MSTVFGATLCTMCSERALKGKMVSFPTVRLLETGKMLKMFRHIRLQNKKGEVMCLMSSKKQRGHRYGNGEPLPVP
jgi:glutaredoxin-related protein